MSGCLSCDAFKCLKYHLAEQGYVCPAVWGEKSRKSSKSKSSKTIPDVDWVSACEPGTAERHVSLGARKHACLKNRWLQFFWLEFVKIVGQSIIYTFRYFWNSNLSFFTLAKIWRQIQFTAQTDWWNMSLHDLASIYAIVDQMLPENSNKIYKI